MYVISSPHKCSLYSGACIRRTCRLRVLKVDVYALMVRTCKLYLVRGKNLYCAWSQWYDEWEHRKWTTSYVSARKVSNRPFQITRSCSSWELARRMLLGQIQWSDILVMSDIMMIWRVVPHVLFPWVPDDVKFSVLPFIADVKISHLHISWKMLFHWSICYARCRYVVAMHGSWRLGVDQFLKGQSYYATFFV